MKQSLSIDKVSPQANRPTSYFWLDETLNSYEVEELDGHDLARLLPRLSSGMEGLRGFADKLDD